jgi:serine/threonine protein kinase
MLSSSAGRANPNYDSAAEAHMALHRHNFNAATNSFNEPPAPLSTSESSSGSEEQQRQTDAAVASAATSDLPVSEQAQREREQQWGQQRAAHARAGSTQQPPQSQLSAFPAIRGAGYFGDQYHQQQQQAAQQQQQMQQQQQQQMQSRMDRSGQEEEEHTRSPPQPQHSLQTPFAEQQHGGDSRVGDGLMLFPANNNPTGGHPLPGFEDLVRIFESRQTVVLRGVRQSDGQECVIKMPNLKYLIPPRDRQVDDDGSSGAAAAAAAAAGPSRHRLAVFAQQYELLKSLESRGIEGVVRAFDLLSTGPNDESLALVCEYFPGPSLQSYMSSRTFARGFGVLETLKIGIAIAHTLGQIHAENIIHKDMTASNILYQRSSGTIRIIDFGLAGVFPVGSAASAKKNTALQGTLNYLSPEQTGRVSRSVDYRTDLYSFGVVLYQLSCGQLPLTSEDPLELIHCIIAKAPVSPAIIKPAIPTVLADIIMRLLAKNPEARYQSAWGVKVRKNQLLRRAQTALFQTPRCLLRLLTLSCTLAMCVLCVI